MTRRDDELVALLSAAGGGLSHYDERLEAFELDGALQAALDDGRIVRTPIGYQLPDGDDASGLTVGSLVLTIIAALVVLLIVGESFDLWDVFPEDPRRGDWRMHPR